MNKRYFFRKTASMSASVALIIGASAVLTTSYAASSEVEEHAPTMKPISTIPVSGIQVPQTEGIDHVEIAYKSTGEMGLEALNREGREFTLTKDGATILSIPCTTEYVKMSNSDNDAIVVTFPKQTEPGRYTLTVPAGLVKQTQPGKMNEEDPDTPDYQLTSAEYVFSFSVKEAIGFTMSPKPGEYENNALGTFKFVYPEGTVISVNSEARPKLMHFITKTDVDGTTTMREEAKTYTVSAEDNTVTLTATSQSALPYITQNVNLEYYYLTVPAASWTATYEGRDYPIYAVSYSKYDVRKSAASTGLEISPAADDSKTFKPEEFKTITLSYPDNWTPALNVGQTAGYLKQAGTNKPEEFKGYMFGTFKVTSIDTANRTILLSIAPANGYSNNLEQMQSGWYFFELNMRAFKMDGSSTANSQKVDFPPYLVAGVDNLTAPITARSNSKWVPISDINELQGFDGVSLSFPMTVQLAEPQAKIRLLNNGIELASMTASECVASNAMNPNNQTSGRDWYYSLGETINTPGRYTVEVPANTFHQTSYGDFYNTALQIPLNYREDDIEDPVETPAYTLTPDPLKNLSSAYDLRVVKIIFNDAQSISVAAMNLRNTASLTKPDKTIIYNRNAAATVSGNTLTITFDSAPTDDGDYIFKLFANKVRVTLADGTQQNVPALEFSYRVGIATDVEAIEAATSYSVVSIDGTTLLNNGTEADLKALSPGIYIVNGRKVIVK